MVISGLIAGCSTASTGSATLPGPAAATTTGTATPSAGPAAAPAPTGPVATVAPAPAGSAAEVARVVEATDGGSVTLSAVSCSGPGDCAAVGEYTDRGNHDQGLVMDERNGTWGSAEPVLGLAALNTGGDTDVSLVSCASPGNCSAGGTYTVEQGSRQQPVLVTRPFLIDEKRGVWGPAVPVPGLDAISLAGNLSPPGNASPVGSATLNSLSCGSVGDCSAIGGYPDSAGHGAEFVVSQVAGVWSAAAALPGVVALTGESSALLSTPTGVVSCPGPGDCTAVGQYENRQGDIGTYAATEAGRVWGAATAVRGATSGGANLTAISCASAGDCAAGGGWWATPGTVPTSYIGEQAAVVAETNGVWGQVRTLPGVLALEKGGGTSAVRSVSCGSDGDCAAVGTYQTHDSVQTNAFVAADKNGTWGTAEALSSPVPPGGLMVGGAATVSCTASGACVAGGQYQPAPEGMFAAFIVDDANGAWGVVRAVPGLPDSAAAGRPGVNQRVLSADAISCASPSYCGAVGSDNLVSLGAFVVSLRPGPG